MSAIEFEWEKISEEKEDGVFWFATYRAKVIGGWLVRTFDLTKQHRGLDPALSTSESTVFIADRMHEWQIKKPQELEVAAVEKSDINPELF